MLVTNREQYLWTWIVNRSPHMREQTVKRRGDENEVSPSTSTISSCHASPCPSSVSLKTTSCYGSTCSMSVSAASSYGSLSSGIPSSSAGSSSAAVPGPASGQTSHPSPNCPGLLPRCLNTWMFMSGCKNNSDSKCFCGKESYVENVMGCISAWSTANEEAQAAASYLVGICAAHITSNPAIITASPSTSKLTPLLATLASSAGAVETSSKSQTQHAPYTTITFSAKLVLAVTQSTGMSAGLTIPGSRYTTQLVKTVTVPVVQLATSIVTFAGHTTASVGLSAGTFSSVAAHPTGTAIATSAVSRPSVGAIGGGHGTVHGTAFATGRTPTSTNSSSPIAPATGGGEKAASEVINLAVGALAALAVL